jgi:peptide/nickel transport system substrate-binding protein
MAMNRGNAGNRRARPQIGLVRLFALMAASIICAFPALADDGPVPQHALAMYGEPALPRDFTHFPYANPDAPRGGQITYGVIGTFDSLNPFVLSSMRTTARGMWDPEYGKLIFEPLMTRSADEPFSLYGLIAESATMPDDRSWMEFQIRENAKWSDGQPIVPEDVIFTFELLAEKARPPFNSRMAKIARIEKTGPRKVKFTFNDQSDREFPLIVAGYMPVLPKHATDIENFENSTLTPPVGSGPYLIDSVEPGSRIVYRRRSDYWGDDLAVNRGQLNFDRIVVEYFRSVQSRFEAFKKGLYDIHVENDPAQWRRAYDFPAVEDGRVKKETFEIATPATMDAFVFNTRRPVFADVRVREALAELFDFEWINRNLFFDVYERTGSFWHGSQLSSLGRAASDEERALLAPFPGTVRDDVVQGTWRPAVTDGTGNDRKVMKEAFQLLQQAGYRREGGRLAGPDGKPLEFEILTKSESEERLAIAFKRTLERVGVTVDLRSVDDAQYQRRTQDFDYDMILASYGASLSPGAEQLYRWGSRSRDLPGSFNYAGAANPAIDATIHAMLDAREPERFEAAVRALDRILVSQQYVVPLFHLSAQYIAHWDRIAHPGVTPIYGNQYTVWWERAAAR